LHSVLLWRSLRADGWRSKPRQRAARAHIAAAAEISERAPRRDDATAAELTRRLFAVFGLRPLPEAGLLARLRPILTHRFVPWPFRVRPGAIDLVQGNGDCDVAARALMLVLQQAGYGAVQVNLVSPSSGHVAVIATLPDGKAAYLDPFFGLTARSAEGPMALEEAKRRVLAGEDEASIFVSLVSRPLPDFYRAFGKAVFARQNQPLLMEAEVVLKGEPLRLGKTDGESDDVSTDAGRHGLTPFWHYIGNRHDRAWVRALTVRQPTRIVMRLVRAPSAKFVTSDRPARIVGNDLIYDLAAGETLRFVDGKAGYDWLRGVSYIGVDMIEFLPL